MPIINFDSKNDHYNKSPHNLEIRRQFLETACGRKKRLIMKSVIDEKKKKDQVLRHNKIHKFYNY